MSRRGRVAVGPFVFRIVWFNCFKTSVACVSISSQDFNKYSRFNTRLKVPKYSSDPTVGEVGDLIEVSGKLKICTVASLTAPTFTIVGTQS